MFLLCIEAKITLLQQTTFFVETPLETLQGSKFEACSKATMMNSVAVVDWCALIVEKTHVH